MHGKPQRTPTHLAVLVQHLARLPADIHRGVVPPLTRILPVPNLHVHAELPRPVKERLHVGPARDRTGRSGFELEVGGQLGLVGYVVSREEGGECGFGCEGSSD